MAQWMTRTVFVGVLFVVVGCGAGGRTGTGRTLLTSGFESSTVALSTRQQPLVLGVGEDVLVFGGYADGNGGARSLGDGALYDRSSGSWSKIANAPFSRPLFQPIGVWTGRDAVIFGTPCGSTWTDLVSPSCGTGGVEVAAFSPTTNAWRRLRGVRGPDPSQGVPTNATVQGSGLGWTGRDAVFSVGNGPVAELMLVDPSADGSARFVGTPDRIDATCVTGGQVVAVQTGEVFASGVRVGPNPVANAEPLRTYTLDQTALAWSAPVETKKPDSIGALSEHVSCDAGQLVYMPYQTGTGFTGGLWWNATQQTWERVPSFKPAQYAVLAVGESNGTKVVWLRSSLYILAPGASTWSVVAAPFDAMMTFREGTSALVVDATNDPRESGSSRVGFLDPSRYLAAHT